MERAIMRYFDYKILIILTSVYFFESKSDSSVLAQLNTNLSSLANYSQVINFPQKKVEYTGMEWNEWYQKCKELPFGRDPKIGFKNYKNKAIEWDELDKAIIKFIEVNTEILSKSENWLNDAPNANDPFFTIKDKPLDPIQPFVQKLIVNPDIKIGFHGDFHSDVHSMIEYIQRLNTDGYMDGFNIKDPNKFHLVFLGDYEDRGNYGAEVWYTLMRLKIANPYNVIIIRGNHEDINTCFSEGFMGECRIKFQDTDFSRFTKITRIFDFLPAALYLGSGTDKLIN